MLEFLRALGFGRSPAAPQPKRLNDNSDDSDGSPPSYVEIADGSILRIGPLISSVDSLPRVDWDAIGAWIAKLSPGQQPEAWSACAKAWLLHLRAALGAPYELTETRGELLLSTLEPELARVSCEFIRRTSVRIVRLLDGIAATPAKGKIVLVVLDAEETYYRYVSHFYPEAGEFAFSGGMYIDTGCGHFVTVKADLQSTEPVIAHELTHASLARLPLPLWLNEGLAVNSEHALSLPRRGLYTPEELDRKHKAFWGAAEIQQFWSGKSFERTDEGNMLSYDLARIMVEQMAKDWASFRRFVLEADRRDAGAASARSHLGVELGAYVCALLDKPPASAWEPAPSGGWR